jgi:hypothetical protein
MTTSELSPTRTARPVAVLTLADGRTVEVVRTEAGEPRQLALEARAGGDVVGLACCELEPVGRSGHLSVSVASEWRRVGLGRGLVQRMLDEVREFDLLYLAGRHLPSDVAARRMLAGTGAIVAHRTGDGLVRVAVAVPHVVRDAA